jgi:hypothetical protein
MQEELWSKCKVAQPNAVHAVCIEVVMKKLKPRKQKVTTISALPTISAHPQLHSYTVSLEKFYTSEFAAIEKWCDQTVPGWYRTGVWPGYIHFAKAQHVTLFLIKWAR